MLLSLLYINFHNLKRCVLIGKWIVTTHLQLNIISGWLRQLFTEPGWTVKSAAGAPRATPLTIPEWISGIGCILL